MNLRHAGAHRALLAGDPHQSLDRGHLLCARRVVGIGAVSSRAVWLTSLFGGGPWTRILHPFLGCLLVLAFSLLAVKFWRDNYLEPRDWAWLRRIDDVVANREEALPEVGRYNGGQKLLFFTIVVCLPMLLLSGLLIWASIFPTISSSVWCAWAGCCMLSSPSF